MGCQEASAAALPILSGSYPLRVVGPGSAMVPGLQLALRGDSDNLGHWGGSGQLKTPNGEIKGCSSVVEHTLFLPRADWFP